MAKITKQTVFDFFKKKGFETKEKRAEMTAEEFATLSADFKTEFEIELAEVNAKLEANDQNQVQMAEVIGKIDTVLTEEGAGDSAGEEGGEAAETTAQTGQVDIMAKVESLIGLVKTQKKTIETLSQEKETPNPKKVGAKVVMIGGGAHTDKYLFGIEAPLFDRTKPWNQVTATKRPLETLAAQGMGVKAKWADYESDFKAEVRNYGSSLAERIATLQDSNELSSLSLAQMDFSGFDNTGWGEAYVVRRQDALIAYLRTLPSVTAIFPVRYGVQDKMEMTNSFLTDFSSAWQSGKVFKGGYSVEPVLAEVFDVMMKHKFENMKALEREYIGYLNREGSFPIKWSMVEWLMVQILTKLRIS